MAITYVNKSTFASGTGALTVGAVAGVAADDLILLLVESANEAIATPSGFTEVTDSPQSTGTAAAAGGVRLAVFYRLATGADTTTSVADTGNHTTAIKLAYRGMDPTTPIHATAGSVQSTASASWTLPAVTTTLQDCLVVLCLANDRDAASTANLSGWTNGSISFTERHDQTVTAGVGGGLGIADGTFAGTGSTGTTAVTNAASNTAAFITLALTPAPRALTLDAQPESFTLTGQDAGLTYLRALVLDAQPTSFSLTGEAAELTVSGVANNYVLEAQAGTFVLTGQDAGLAYLRALNLNAQPGSFTLTGQDADLTYRRALVLDAQPANFSLTGQDASFTYLRALVLEAQPGNLSLTGQPVTFGYGTVQVLDADPGSVTLTGQTATLARGYVLDAQSGAFDPGNYVDPVHTDPAYVGGTDARLLVGRVLNAESGSLSLAGQSATLSVGAATYTLSATAAQRLTEIWARMELDPTRPVTVTANTLTVGSITQALSTSGASRTGGDLPTQTDPDTLVTEIWQRLGLDPANPLVQTTTSLAFGAVTCGIAEVGGAVTVTRNA